MSDFEEESDGQRLIKMLYLGDSGTGKTGSTASLAAGGYNVRILDLDVGVEVLRDYLKNKTSIYLATRPGLWTAEQSKSILKRVKYHTISDTQRMVDGKLTPMGDSWPKINSQLDNWLDGKKSLGGVSTWTSGEVLVVDSLSSLARAAWHYQLGLAGRLFGRAEQSDYFFAQEYLYKLLTYLHTPAVPCHVIVICHIDYREREGDNLLRGFPRTIGKALNEVIPTEWNHMIRAISRGQGDAASRKIITRTTGVVDLKSATPLRVKPEYDLSTGLLEYFRDALASPPLPPKAMVDAAETPEGRLQEGLRKTVIAPLVDNLAAQLKGEPSGKA